MTGSGVDGRVDYVFSRTALGGDDGRMAFKVSVTAFASAGFIDSQLDVMPDEAWRLRESSDWNPERPPDAPSRYLITGESKIGQCRRRPCLPKAMWSSRANLRL